MTLGPLDAPFGPTAPALDMVPVSAPVSDVELEATGRAFLLLTSGTVSVTTVEENDRTFDGIAGMAIDCSITHVLAATTADILVYIR